MNPRCCQTCNRPLIGDVERLEDTCHACHVPVSGTRLSGCGCQVCGVDDPRMLCSRRLADGWTLLCANHAAVLGDRWIGLDELHAACGIARSA